MELSEEINKTMFLVNLKTNETHRIFCTHESKSANSVKTEDGRILRTHTKNQRIFYDRDYARICVKLNLGEDDQELKELLARKRHRLDRAA